MKSKRLRAEIWVSPMLWEDLQTCLLWSVPGIIFARLFGVPPPPGVPVKHQFRASFGITSGTRLYHFSQSLARDEECQVAVSTLGPYSARS